jgi:hypothetical protein
MVVRVRRFVLSLRMDGVRATVRRVWTRVFGEEQAYVFVRYLQPPPTPVTFPADANGVRLRKMEPGDLKDHRIRRYKPAMPHSLSDGIIALRDGQIVGAAWYTDTVTAAQPWYEAVAPHLIPPARFTANIFVVPGDKGASWALAKTASECLASTGVRTIVGVIGARNTPSILVSRMLGSKMVAQMSLRHRLGRTTATVQPVATDHDAGISPKRC